jgi:hypothetical protein
MAKSVTCSACGTVFDGHGPVFVDSSGGERWFCSKRECIDKISAVLGGKCTWCGRPLSSAEAAVTGSSLGDRYCSEDCRHKCGKATGDAQRRMGLW